jgi:hypothetical protein
MALRMNGEARQRSHSSRMSVEIPEVLAHDSPTEYSAEAMLSRRERSQAGQLLRRSSGLVSETGRWRECEIEKIGVPRNPGDFKGKAYGPRPAAPALPENRAETVIYRKRSTDALAGRCDRLAKALSDAGFGPFPPEPLWRGWVRYS